MNQQFGICNLALIPLRAAASNRSEMISQLLFGDHFKILETDGNWLRIVNAYDDYEGWIDDKQYTTTNLNAYVALHDLKTILGLAINQPLSNLSNGQTMNLVAGSNLPDYEAGKIKINAERYKVEGTVIVPDKNSFDNEIIKAAEFYLNTPYLWGGRSPYGIDCSGFTQMVFRQFGIKLKRDAWQQAAQGGLVDFLQLAKTGDLAFFDNEEGNIIHVGIMIDNSRIIHASGKVRTDAIDNHGIYNEELKRYTHKLRIIKRLSPVQIIGYLQ